MSRECPRCGRALAPFAIPGVDIDGCNACGGVWFDAHELNRIAQTNAEHLAALEDWFRDLGPALAPRSGKMLCPNCGVPLFPFKFKDLPGISFDGCRRCKGIWADEGELVAIRERVRR